MYGFSPPTIIHTKFDSVKRRDHDPLSAGLNLVRKKETLESGESERRANDGKCLFIAERHNSSSGASRSPGRATVKVKL